MPATSATSDSRTRRERRVPDRQPVTAQPLPLLLRFISCGIVSVAFGLIWRLTLAPARVAVGSAFAGIFFLLLGFIVGGTFWYLRDARLRARAPERVSDERIVFSFVVFMLVPFTVLVLIGAIWLLAFVIGAT